MKRQNYRNPYQYNYVCSTAPSPTFNCWFWNVHQIQSPTLDTDEATALCKKFQKTKHNLSEISALFSFFFHSFTFSFFVWWFWYGFSQFWFWHLKEESKSKRKLKQKFEALAPYRRKYFCYLYYRERLKNFIFYLLLLFQ